MRIEMIVTSRVDRHSRVKGIRLAFKIIRTTEDQHYFLGRFPMRVYEIQGRFLEDHVSLRVYVVVIVVVEPSQIANAPSKILALHDVGERRQYSPVVGKIK